MEYEGTPGPQLAAMAVVLQPKDLLAFLLLQLLLQLRILFLPHLYIVPKKSSWLSETEGQFVDFDQLWHPILIGDGSCQVWRIYVLGVELQ